ncbi:hypothetical protein ABC502_03855 [Alkalimonas sp. NCh-2]|uniref:hypothetical protein n=1 Tax=Alkalimonas sp. NCh-2 TaxID=3144846 RepID=UPI0031F6F8F7
MSVIVPYVAVALLFHSASFDIVDAGGYKDVTLSVKNGKPDLFDGVPAVIYYLSLPVKYDSDVLMAYERSGGGYEYVSEFSNAVCQYGHRDNILFFMSKIGYKDKFEFGGLSKNCVDFIIDRGDVELFIEYVNNQIIHHGCSYDPKMLLDEVNSRIYLIERFLE